MRDAVSAVDVSIGGIVSPAPPSAPSSTISEQTASCDIAAIRRYFADSAITAGSSVNSDANSRAKRELENAGDDAERRAVSRRHPARARRSIRSTGAEILSDDRRGRRAESDADHEQPTLHAVANAERGERRRTERRHDAREENVDQAERDAGDRRRQTNATHGPDRVEPHAADAQQPAPRRDHRLP